MSNMSNDAATKLGTALGPNFQRLEDNVKACFQTNLNELLVQVNIMNTKIDNLQRALETSKTTKKAAPRGAAAAKSDMSEDTDVADGAGVADGATTSAATAAKVGTPQVYFLKKFKDDEAFRSKYYTTEAQAAFEESKATNPEYLKAKTPVTQLTATAKFVFNFLKQSDKALFATYTAEHNAAKSGSA